MERLSSIIDGAKNGWKNLDKKKKIAMISLVIGILVLVSTITYYASRTEYDVLFTNLELEDAGIIVDDLESKKIPYKIENGGRNILVDKDKVDQYRLQLAMDGMMPENSTGFEIFDETGMMTTDEDRDIMYQRALTGELQRSIMSLDAIEAAKVHLVMPEESIFETEQKQASASVILKIKPGQQVTSEMIKGIGALVSGAVDNLPMENIQVIDTKGNLLSGVLQEENNVSAMDVASQYQKVKEDFEKQLENNLMDILGTAYGRNKVKVQVYADLDFDSEETTSITYDVPVMRSEQVRVYGDDIDVQNITGGNINDNISNVIEGEAGAGSSYEHIINNEVGSTTTTTIKAPGKVNRISTSVVYDGILTDEQAASMRNIVATATGYNEDRGDFISIEGVVFDRSYEEELEDEFEGMPLPAEGILRTYGIYALIGLLVIIGIVGTVIFVRRRRRDKELEEELLLQEQLALATEEEEEEKIEPIIKIKPDKKERRAQSYAKENPDLAADLIKAWLKDE